ncbi:hypothetical protein BH11PSE11_BH11PSE11_14060 [soil metagenome]
MTTAMYPQYSQQFAAMPASTVARQNAAIVFAPEDYSASAADPVGRAVAGFGFLRAFAKYAQVGEFFGCPVRQDAEQGFLDAIGRWGKGQACHLADVRRHDVLSSIGCLYRPDPLIGSHAWARQMEGASSAWSICGITHTTASTQVMGGIADWAIAPVQPWDAVICTSHSVKAMVVNVLETHEDYLRERLGASRKVRPQLPVIPLGVAAEDFRFSEAERQRAREELGLSPQAIAVLFVGRLSYHDKAHPLALYQALEAAASGREVVLIECGWHADATISRAFSDAAAAACPSIRTVQVDDRNVARRQSAWRAADIFTSLSDSIQETFGLTPVEAMAAGLPVVVSDWDGYKDTVRDGVDGFRIPTYTPASGSGIDLGQRHALSMDNYDMYCGYVGQLVAVDIAAAARAFRMLFEDAGLRKRIGAAGRQRVAECFDWKTIIPCYQDLWAELALIRKHAASVDKNESPRVYPDHMDPFHLFSSYPTAQLSSDVHLARVGEDARLRLARWRALDMVAFAEGLFPTSEECEAVLRQFDRKAVIAARELVAGIDEARRPWVFRGLAWMVKMGVLKLVN